MTKVCTKCDIEKDENDFTKTKTVCKQCRAKQKKDLNKQNKINNRQNLREEFKNICLNDGYTIEEFSDIFVKKEDIPKLKRQPKLFLCEAPDDLKKKIMAEKPNEFFKGYIVDIIMFIDDEKKKKGLKFII
jgi:NCAIR mutase (PurE)-related protein